MSSTTLVKRFKVDGVLVDPTSIKLSDATGTYGVKRTDTDAVVVADGTALTKVSTGVYSYTWTDPADGLTYAYVLEIVYGSETYRFEGTVEGGTDTSENLYDLTDRMRPYLGQATEGLLKQALREMAAQWCRDTGTWREEVTLTSVEDEDEYSLASSYDAQIKRVAWVKLDDYAVEYSTVTGADTLKLKYAATEDDLDIDAELVLVPEEACVSFPDWFLGRWGWAIAAGAVAWLLSQQGQPWATSDPSPHWERYYDGVAQGKRETWDFRTSGDQTVTFRGDYFV